MQLMSRVTEARNASTENALRSRPACTAVSNHAHKEGGAQARAGGSHPPSPTNAADASLFTQSNGAAVTTIRGAMVAAPRGGGGGADDMTGALPSPSAGRFGASCLRFRPRSSLLMSPLTGRTADCAASAAFISPHMSSTVLLAIAGNHVMFAMC
jgi:hypothetical protein